MDLSSRWQRLGPATVLFSFFVVGISLIPSYARAATLSFDGLRSIDVMKYTKDVVTSQQADSVIDSIVSVIKPLGITHIGISIPMDATTDYPSASTPAPRTAEAFTQKWADTIHGNGLKAIWRGTFSGIEGIYGFTKLVGGLRLPPGTAATAAADGTTTWLGKIYQYITKNPSFFADGDVWAPLPERTEGIFQDATSFLPYDGAGIQSNYATFFNDLKTVSDQAFASIGKHVITGMTANNFSEVASSWLPQSLFDTAGYIAVDYYGSTHTPQEMDTDLRRIAQARGKPVFIQEWGDYWTGSLDQAARTTYLQSMYDEINKLVKDGVVIGFNSWSGWAGSQESSLALGSLGFSLNYAGSTLGTFLTGTLSNVVTNVLASTTQTSTTTSTDTSSTTQTQVTNTSTTQTTSTDTSGTGGTTTTTTSSGSSSGTTSGGGSSVTTNPLNSCGTPGTNAFLGCYYSDSNFGTLAYTRTDPTINFTWNSSSPVTGVPVDNFSVRWQGNFNFVEGTYMFTTNTDDGVRLYVDGAMVIDAWYGQTASYAHTASKYMTAGSHLVVMEYYEATGAAAAQLRWNKINPDTSWTATYYQGTNFQKQLLSRQDKYINFTWGSGSPDPRVPADNFSARWQGTYYFDDGKHTFTMTADDGARLYLDGKLIIDGWKDQPLTVYQSLQNMTGGLHTLRMEYYEKTGGATAKLGWN